MSATTCLFLSLLVASVCRPTVALRQSEVPPKPKFSLQRQHPVHSPASTFDNLSHICHQFGIEKWDVYGDYNNQTRSFLRQFEAEIAAEFGTDDAVFMPSGVMAQSIALLIYKRSGREKFACHHSSHLILHEQEGYRELLGMEALVIPSTETKRQDGTFRSHQAMTFDNVENTINDPSELSSFILELPHRELGGKCTSLNDIEKIRDYCLRHNIALHCDGARVFEATAAYKMTPKEIASYFDSVYISFYKGLGGISGAMLLGSNTFCEEARVWLRRFGGNLYTLLPYFTSGYDGYQQNWVTANLDDSAILSFVEKRNKLIRIVKTLSAHAVINKIIAFDPPIPEVSMVHVYLKTSVTETNALANKVVNAIGIELLLRCREVSAELPSYGQGYRSVFELSMGEENAKIPVEVYEQAWLLFAKYYVSSNEGK